MSPLVWLAYETIRKELVRTLPPNRDVHPWRIVPRAFVDDAAMLTVQHHALGEYITTAEYEFDIDRVTVEFFIARYLTGLPPEFLQYLENVTVPIIRKYNFQYSSSDRTDNGKIRYEVPLTAFITSDNITEPAILSTLV